MLFGSDRTELRRFFVRAWQRARSGAELEPLERQLAGIIDRHPEYHPLLETGVDAALERDYGPEGGETNPFLHMAMHMAILEQVSTDRPPGIAAAYRALCARTGDAHAAEHAMMECLGEALWRAQRDGAPPDEHAYLVAVRRLAGVGPDG